MLLLHLKLGCSIFPHLAVRDGDCAAEPLFRYVVPACHLVLFPLTPRTAEWGDLIGESLAMSCISPLG